jgi:histidinol-phosphate aminotransferase
MQLNPNLQHHSCLLLFRQGRDAKGVKDALAQDHGIIVRHYAKKELSGYIRISVGKPEHTDKLIAALKAL